MATAIQIEVLVDDKGVVQGVNRVVDAVNRVPGAGEPAFNKLNESEKRAHETALLLNETLGVRIPRGITNVISKVPGLSSALSAAFQATAVIAFIGTIAELARHFDQLQAKVGELALSIAAMFSTSIRNQLREEDVRDIFKPIDDQVASLNKAAQLAGKDGFSQITAQLHASNEELDRFSQRFKIDIEKQFGTNSSTTVQIETRLSRKLQEMRAFDEEAANAQVLALRRKNAEELLAIEVQGEVVGKSEIEKLRLQLAADLKKIDIGAAGDPSAEGAAARTAQKRAMVANEAAQENEIQRQALIAGIHTRLEAEASAAKGEEQIRLELVAKLNEITDQERQKGVILANDRVAAETQADAKIRDLRRAASDQIFDAEQKAAVASVPQWEQSNAQIVADFQKRQREIDQQLRDTVINSAEADRLRQANWNETNGKMAQDYASQFESLYNDITSGSIGQRINAQMRKFFFNLLGQWAAALRQGGGASTGGGGILGAIGGLLGIGGLGGASSGGGSGTGPYGLPAGVAMSFAGGGEFGGLTASDFGWQSAGGPGVDLSGLPGSSVGSGTLSAGRGTGPIAAQQSGIAGVLGSLFSAKSLSQLAPLALVSSLMLGSKGGASAIAAGGLIGALGLGALYGPSTSATLAAAPFAPFLGPLAGGLVGFGVGSMTGSPTLGGLSGAGSGALVGLLAAGPVGALIGGLIGGLAGLFGGIFGGGPSKHSQADKWIQANVVPAIQTELTNYQGFSTDFSTAMSDLEKLKSDSYNQLKQQFGKDATNDEWGRYVVPAVAQAEQTLQGLQDERNRRSSINFGLPQFAEGGPVLAVLHEGEHVMTAAATRRFGHSTFDAMNSAAKSGASVRSGGDVHIHINALDASSFNDFLRKEGAQLIGEAVDKHYVPRYSGFGRG